MSGPKEAVVVQVLPQTELAQQEQQGRAELESAMRMAKKYPRFVKNVRGSKEFMDECRQMVCQDADIAAQCYYKLPRGGKTIEGPSIRLAEVISNNWKNLWVDGRVVEIGDTYLVARGIAIDLENNTMWRQEVRRRITDKNGNRYNEDMINTTGNAAVSIATRNVILRVVPGIYVEPILEEAKKTAIGDVSTLAERRTKMCERFKAFGVTDAEVLAKVGRTNIADIGLKDMETLFGIYNRIKQGEIDAHDAMLPDSEVDEETGEIKTEVKAAAPAGPVKLTPRQRLNAVELRAQGAKNAGEYLNALDVFTTAEKTDIKKLTDAQLERLLETLEPMFPVKGK